MAKGEEFIPVSFERYHCNSTKEIHYKSVAIDYAWYAKGPQIPQFLIKQPSGDLSKLCYKKIRKHIDINNKDCKNVAWEEEKMKNKKLIAKEEESSSTTSYITNKRMS